MDAVRAQHNAVDTNPAAAEVLMSRIQHALSAEAMPVLQETSELVARFLPTDPIEFIRDMWSGKRLDMDAATARGDFEPEEADEYMTKFISPIFEAAMEELMQNADEWRGLGGDAVRKVALRGILRIPAPGESRSDTRSSAAWTVASGAGAERTSFATSATVDGEADLEGGGIGGDGAPSAPPPVSRNASRSSGGLRRAHSSMRGMSMKSLTWDSSKPMSLLPSHEDYGDEEVEAYEDLDQPKAATRIQSMFRMGLAKNDANLLRKARAECAERIAAYTIALREALQEASLVTSHAVDAGEFGTPKQAAGRLVEVQLSLKGWAARRKVATVKLSRFHEDHQRKSSAAMRVQAQAHRLTAAIKKMPEAEAAKQELNLTRARNIVERKWYTTIKASEVVMRAEVQQHTAAAHCLEHEALLKRIEALDAPSEDVDKEVAKLLEQAEEEREEATVLAAEANKTARQAGVIAARKGLRTEH
ncbi:hypothetical protein FNF27_05739 [Cafeteria roenbergensis]|uniref:Uncharacterized protein n=1 Tax=Cafeteria roenbergensis TaxID=33653 RepID=A0A5A8E5P5_CAFRO|nr:hypothetical protein FNF27_05739 [Cafeteria roenbergensis]